MNRPGVVGPAVVKPIIMHSFPRLPSLRRGFQAIYASKNNSNQPFIDPELHERALSTLKDTLKVKLPRLSVQIPLPPSTAVAVNPPTDATPPGNDVQDRSHSTRAPNNTSLPSLSSPTPVPLPPPSPTPPGPNLLQERALSILTTPQQLNWREFTEKLGGTLVISDDEHRDIVQQAARDKTLSFGFSAGGLLFPYYIGVAGALQDAGLLTDDTKLGGASAGSLIAACIKAGMPLDDVTEQCLRLMHDCRVHGTRGRLGPVLEAFLEDHLPEDAHERCREKAYVAVTKALPYIRPLLVSDFETRGDLIRALMTSCHIPWYLTGEAYTEFRGAAHLDGGLTNFIPVVPGTVGIRVCCFPSRQLSPLYRIGISPDSYDEDWPYSLRQMVQWAFEPPEEEQIVLYLIDKGKVDAQRWMDHMGLVGGEKEEEEKKAEEGGAVAASMETVISGATGGVGVGVSVEKGIEQGGEILKEKANEEEKQEKENEKKGWLSSRS